MALLDSTCVKELSEIVEKLTHTGQKVLDQGLLKKLKGICRLSNSCVNHAFHLVVHELNKEHAEIRFSAFQVVDELFRRSHCFRELVITDLRQIMDLTAETNLKRPLPLPKSVAQDLKRLALKTMQEWNKEFGAGYKKLQIGFNFLTHCKKIDFNALNNESLAEQARIEERERRQNRVNEERLRVANIEITELEPEIKNTITAMQNCISLLVPTPENFFINEDKDELRTYDQETNCPSTSRTVIPQEEKEQYESDEESDSEAINLREYGILNHQQTIKVEVRKGITKIKETEANSAIIENARDLFRLLSNRYLPNIKKWIQVISKATGASDQLKQMMDLKQLLETAVEKYSLLKLQDSSHDTSESSDSDFEEVVDKDGFEATVKEDLLLTMIEDMPESTRAKDTRPSWCIWSKENNDKDPTTPQCTRTAMAASHNKTVGITPASTTLVAREQSKIKERVETIVKCPVDFHQMPSTSKDTDRSRKSKLLAVAPKLPFDVDLYHWEDEKVPIPTMLSTRVEGYQKWASSAADGLEELEVPDGSVALRTRVMEYSGKFQPVKWACRAPLGNGKLCPRRDRFKCPFHGAVVARDETGKCSREEDAKLLQQAADKEEAETPDWQDPQLLEEIKAATGVDLKMPDKKGRRGKKKAKVNKYPGLTDIKAKLNTPHSRLSKKVFKKSAMKRVSKALDTMDHKRFRDKYGDQFHYMYNTA